MAKPSDSKKIVICSHEYKYEYPIKPQQLDLNQ